VVMIVSGRMFLCTKDALWRKMIDLAIFLPTLMRYVNDFA
jgi:hypothetical protein